MNNQCQSCFSAEKPKLITCPCCFKPVCKLCKPVSSPQCMSCIRSQIREEVIKESTEKKNQLKQHLQELMDTAQHTQIEIECLNEKHCQLENYLKSSSISHLEKINNLQASIEKARRDIIPYSTLDNLEIVVENIKKSEKEKKTQFQQLLDQVESEEIQIYSEKELERISQDRINDLRGLSNNCIPYNDVRGIVCGSCGKGIKKRFRDVIVNGNGKNESVLKSISDHDYSESLKSSLVTRQSTGTKRTRPSVKPLPQEKKEGCSCECF